MTAADTIPAQRQEILSVARTLTLSPADAASVVRAATPLLAWVQSGADADDLALRVWALSEQADSYKPAGGAASVEFDRPGTFLRDAKALYAFAAGEVT